MHTALSTLESASSSDKRKRITAQGHPDDHTKHATACTVNAVSVATNNATPPKLAL